MTECPTSYFRYDEVLVGEGYIDELGEYVSTGSHVKLQLHEYEVIKQTPTGVRLNDYGRSEHGRLVSRNWNKQWACPTVEEARQSFMARKKRQIRILEARLKTAREAHSLALFGSLPDSVGWLAGCKPEWARGSDPSAQVAKTDAAATYAKMEKDFFA